ncbi:MAG: septum formation initiator family protein [Desulfosalsimonadaceae bacterium]
MSNASTNRPRIVTAAFYALSLLLFVYAGVIVFGDSGFLHLQRMQTELAQLKAQNASIEEENNALYHTVHRLKNDPVYIEHVIRKQLQMNAPGEIIFKFENR